MTAENVLWTVVLAIVALIAIFVITRTPDRPRGPVIDEQPACVIVLPDSPDPRPLPCRHPR